MPPLPKQDQMSLKAKNWLGSTGGRNQFTETSKTLWAAGLLGT